MRNRKLSVMVGLAVLLAVLALLFTVAGCSKQEPTSSSTTSSSTTSAPQTTVPAAAKTIEFKFATEQPPESALVKDLWIPWAQDIEKATNGRVKITIYPGESLGASNTYIEAIKSGMIDIAWDSLDYFEGRFVLSMVGYYPLGAKTPGTMCYVWWDLYKQFPEIQSEFEGMKVLAVDGSTAYQVFSSKNNSKDVNTIEDLQGLKLKAGGGTLNDAVKALGGSPVTIPAPQQFEAIQKGVIDGSWFPIVDSTNFVLQEVCRSVTKVDGPPCGFFTVMSPDSYAKMTPEDQKIFDSYCGDALIARTAKFRYTCEANAIETLTKAGCKFITPAPAEYTKFQEALATMSGPWIEKVNASGKPGTKIYETAKGLVTKWESAEWWK